MTPTGAAARPVLVARPAGRGEALVALLAQQGVAAEHRPFVRLALEDTPQLREAAQDLAAGAFTHLVVTSRTAVEALGALADGPLRIAPGTRVIAVGEGTAEALREAGAGVDLVAAGSGEALVKAIDPAAEGDRVLFPASSAAATTVREGLEAAGYAVTQVVAYRPRSVPQPPEVVAALAEGRYAAIVLTSPMIARLVAALSVHLSIPVVTIGRPTSEAARAAGLTVHQQARAATDEALAEAVRTVLTDPKELP